MSLSQAHDILQAAGFQLYGDVGGDPGPWRRVVGQNGVPMGIEGLYVGGILSEVRLRGLMVFEMESEARTISQGCLAFCR